MSRRRRPGPIIRRRERDPIHRVTWAGAKTRADVEDAKQATHDILIEEVGDRRTSPVRWRLLPARKAAEMIRTGDLSVQDRAADREMVRYLTAPDVIDTGWLVLADVETDYTEDEVAAMGGNVR